VLVKKGDTTEANIPRGFRLLWDRDMWNELAYLKEI